MAKDRYHSLGAKLGPRLAKVLSDAQVHTERRLLDHRHRLAMHVFESASNMIGGEMKAAAGDLLEEVARHPATPPHMARTLLLAASGKGQGGAILSSMILGGGASNSLGTLISNALYAPTAAIVARDPHIPPDPETISQLVARGFVGYGHGQDTAEGQGRPSSWFEAEVEAGRAWPDIPMVLELLRRGKITNDEASKLLQHLGVPAEVFGPILSLREEHVGPADAALALLRGNISEARALKIAADAGLDKSELDLLVGNTGEPPGLGELIMLWRRGHISTEKLDEGIRQSRVRNEWIPIVHRLSIQPPSQSEALQALVEGQISHQEAERRFKEDGGDPTWFEAAYHTRGTAPSPVELGVLANRGIIPWEGTGPDVTSFVQGVHEGSSKNKWIKAWRRLAEYYPPPRTLPTLYKSGAIGKAEMIRLLMDQGLTRPLAEAYVKSASGEKTRVHKDLAVGQVGVLYRDHAISKDEAMGMWEDLGYDRHEANFLALTIELERVQRSVERAITTVHGRYISWHIGRTEAATELDKIGVPARQREELLHLWDLERQTKVVRLTPAEVKKAVKKGLLTEAEGLDRLHRLGYQEPDAGIYLQL